MKQKKTPQKGGLKQIVTDKQINLPTAILVIIAVATAGTILATYENNYLFRAQELNLFLPTPLFLKQQMVQSGGLLTYAGTYFTQYLYHPALGTALLGIWWLLLIWLLCRTFNLTAKYLLLTLIPVALLIIIITDLGYWIYYIKLPGHIFTTTIGTTASVALAYCYRTLPRKYLIPTIFIPAATALSYPLAGFYGLLATALMAILAWRQDGYSLSRRIADTAVAIAAIALTPIIYYYTIYYQTNITNIYYTALPIFRIDKDYTTYYIPFCLLALTLAAFAATYRTKRNTQVKHPVFWAAAQIALLATISASLYHFWYKDENFHTELAMHRQATNGQWEEILQTYRNHDAAPSRVMWMTKNLALARLGRQGDEMYHYRNGDKAPAAPFIVRMAQCGGKLIYYNYGLLNYCYRWCMEDGVEYGWHAEYLVYMLKCSILNNEMTVAQKYADLLKLTKYYRQVALKYEHYIKNPSLIDRDKELSTIKHLLPPVNELTSDQSLVEIFLINHFSNHDSQDPVFQEQAMIFALQSKDIDTFWKRFSGYAQTLDGRHMPTHIQEAAYLYGHLENKVDISNMPFDKEVIESYNNFMAMAQQYSNFTESQLKEIMYDRFGGTFYYDYFLTRDQHSY